MKEFNDMISTPTISENLWRIMVDGQSSFTEPRILEFGSGGSTFGFIDEYFKNKGRYKSMKIVSFEHWPVFYRYLGSFLAGHVEKKSPSGLTFTVYKIRGPREDLSAMVNNIKANKIYSVPPVYNILSSRKSTVYDPVRWAVMIVDILHKRIRYMASKMLSLLDYYLCAITGRSIEKWERVLVKKGVSSNELKYYLDKKIRSGKYLIEIRDGLGTFQFDYYLLPERTSNPVWRRMDIDGTFEEFEDYVLFPLEGRFNMVYLDGRSRVSCARRIFSEGLLSEDGYLFMHDAYKEWYRCALADMYNKGTTVDGNNRRLNGEILIPSSTGKEAGTIREELYMFKRGSEKRKS